MLEYNKIKKLLGIIGDQKDDLKWMVRDDKLKFFINSNDIFTWAVSDAEEIKSQEDIELLEKSIEDCKKYCIDFESEIYNRMRGEEVGTILFCCRKKQMRPQGALYKELVSPSLWHLFDKCGPERESGIGNPADR